MQPAFRRALLLATIVSWTSAVAHAQTTCDRLVPIGIQPPQGGFEFGCAHRYLLIEGFGADGRFLPLAYPACEAGPCAGLTEPFRLVCEAASGYSCCISVSQAIPIIPGVHSGQLASGINQRIANDADTRAGICYSDYVGNGSRIGDVPLILPVGSGTTQAQVAGFLRVFFVGPPVSTVFPVEFIAGPTPVRSTTWGQTKLLYR